MKVKNNYNECLTNLACSIRKYFDLEYHHKTLDYIDKLLEEKHPKNVVVILYDGMGSRILDRHLTNDEFFISNRLKEITTVFPATTTAATTSMRTGLNPKEHGYLGWNVYIKQIDETISLFLNTKKGTEEISQKFLENKDKLFKAKSIVEEINEQTNNHAIELFPFGDNPYNDLDDMLNKIKEETNKEGKRYIYAYDPEPDHTMHELGPDSKEVHKLIKERQEKTENLCNTLKDTLVIVVADHGHIKVDNIFLKDYPKITNLLERTTSLEERTMSFKVKENLKEQFVSIFNELFKDYYNLYSKEEVITSNLFGDGKENPIFKDAIGDYIAIAKTEKTLVNIDEDILYSHHAGYTDDEIYVPLIIKYCGKEEHATL